VTMLQQGKKHGRLSGTSAELTSLLKRKQEKNQCNGVVILTASEARRKGTQRGKGGNVSHEGHYGLERAGGGKNL